MEFRVYFKHMESSLPLYAYAEKKLGERISKYVSDPIEAHVTFDFEGEKHVAAFNLVAGHGFSMQVEHRDPENMYSCIDILADKLDRRLCKHKEKMKSHKMRRLIFPLEEASTRDPDSQTPLRESIDAGEIIRFESARQKMLERRLH